MLTEMLQYGFVLRALEAGILIAVIAPLIGIFLVLKRYSLIADTLSHVSFAGVACGILLGLDPILTAIAASVAASFGIERLRRTRKIYGETALSLFLSGSLALAIVILSLARSANANLVSYLFGSLVTVTTANVAVIAALSLGVFAAVVLLYRELLYVTFDEDGARVSGVPVGAVNTVFMVLCALTVSLAIPVVGVLLISALIVIPVTTALQLRLDFPRTLLAAEAVSVFSVIAGITASFYLDLASGGTIVLIMLGLFAFFYAYGKTR